MSLPGDYAERVYAGILGKMIGVYAGRPFEQWPHEAIVSKFGEIDRYVAAEAEVPLVVADDDLSGTLTFVRAIEDFQLREPDAQAVAETWLNYIIPGRSILWWGGVGYSTEHTAFIRLKNGVRPPLSGSAETNGDIIANQIGAQIFIDAWGLIHPDDPQEAARWAYHAACVSHDAIAIHGAQVIAAMVAKAFSASSVSELIDAGLSVIPADCELANVIRDVESWKREGLDWRQGLVLLADKYGYHRYLGGCHIIPNHAVVIHSLVQSDGDFDEAMRIVNTCGFDTDCNAANVGCILGVLNGLPGLEKGYDWRGPVADRILLPTADGTRCVTDAVLETRAVERAARTVRNLPAEPHPRFEFPFAGSVQGFTTASGHPVLWDGGLRLAESEPIFTPTFPSPEDLAFRGSYDLVACPTLWPGAKMTLHVSAHQTSHFAILVRDVSSRQVTTVWEAALQAGEHQLIADIPPSTEWPIQALGLQVHGDVTVRSIDWRNEPIADLSHLRADADAHRIWVDAMDVWNRGAMPIYPVSHAEGVGLLLTGAEDFENLCFEAEVMSFMSESVGLVVGAKHLRTYISAELHRSKLRIVQATNGLRTVLAETEVPFKFGERTPVRIETSENLMTAICGDVRVSADIASHGRGMIGLLVQEGSAIFSGLSVRPV